MYRLGLDCLIGMHDIIHDRCRLPVVCRRLCNACIVAKQYVVKVGDGTVRSGNDCNDLISVSSVRHIYNFYYTAQCKSYCMSVQFDGHSQTLMP